MSVSATPKRITIEQWKRDWATRDERYELVYGVATLAPTEDYRNLNATARLIALFVNALDSLRWWFAPHGGVTLREGTRPTVRIPDFAVVRRTEEEGHLRRAGDVAVVVEVVSPSSKRTDRIVKRREYASARISAYLIVEVLGEKPHLTLLTNPSGQDYATETAGHTLTLHVDGQDITVHALDLT